ADKYKNTELWIVGMIRNEKFFQLLKEKVKELGLQHRVTFLSYPGYIGNIFELVDIQVHASRFDSLPNSILEGMSVGKPLIASEVGGIPDMVIHNKTGLIFNPNDTNSLGNHLDRFVSDDLYRSQLGLAAKERFDQYYSPDFLSLQIENIFKDLYTKHYN
ncbi:MAG: glycosyl transferase group 1, partial [Daejeonella sp.]|nr:glycosyl transferase group 1 [Daejeonella sp.]